MLIALMEMVLDNHFIINKRCIREIKNKTFSLVIGERKSLIMFCRKCGNKLMDTDVYCSKCGVKIETPIPAKDETDTGHSFKEGIEIKQESKLPYNGIVHDVLKFFVCLIILITIVSMLYATLLPPSISLSQFITDPRGLNAVVSFSAGSAIIPFLFAVPILHNMRKIGMIEKTHKIEVLFLMILLEVIAEFLIGRSYLSYPFMIHFIVPILLLIILICGKLKRKADME